MHFIFGIKATDNLKHHCGTPLKVQVILLVASEDRSGIAKVMKIYPLDTMNLCVTFRLSKNKKFEAYNKSFNQLYTWISLWGYPEAVLFPPGHLHVTFPLSRLVKRLMFVFAAVRMLEIMLTDYCQVNTSCWWSVVYQIKILDRLYFIVLIFKLRTRNTVSIHPKTKILFVLSCWYFCASLYCFLLALYLGDWSEAVNYGWISFAVWHFNQRDSSAAACVCVCVFNTMG